MFVKRRDARVLLDRQALAYCAVRSRQMVPFFNAATVTRCFNCAQVKAVACSSPGIHPGWPIKVLGA